MAVAVLLTFLLSPVVGALQQRGLGRVPAVFVTVLLALSVLSGVGWTLAHQLVTLADELPRLLSTRGNPLGWRARREPLLRTNYLLRP